MSELLTYEEYKSLGASLDFPQSPFIDGKYYKGSGALLATLNPSTGKELTSITTANDKMWILQLKKQGRHLIKVVGVAYTPLNEKIYLLGYASC